MRGHVEDAASSIETQNESVGDVLGLREDFDTAYSEPITNAEDLTLKWADQPQEPES